jgi:hypothetical protein
LEFDDVEDERDESPDDKIVREHRAIYTALDRRMRRFAELVKRETGVQSLWLGYPLLYVVTGEADAQQWILAPIFLWPISIQLVHSQEGRVLVGRDPKAGRVKFNRALASWVSRQLSFELHGPGEDQLDSFSWADVEPQIVSLAQQFRDPPSLNCNEPLEPVPNARLLSPQQSPRLFNSAVLGIYRWQNEAILADVEKLKGNEQVNGVVSGFTSGEALPKPQPVQRPPEADRYQVYDADFSQERVIWQARSEPGVVVHGPPGTGKSQTIVNVIADALAHERTILMVCQKYAATRIVFEKLKQVGLDSLCLEVTDTEKNRLSVFNEIRNQVDALPVSALDTSSTRRNQVARDLARLENELDEYSRAIHECDSAIGRPYRQLKTMEGMIYGKFPTVRALPSLQPLLVNLSFQQLEALRRDIEESGRLFGLAKPLTNPWRFYQPMLQPTAVLRADVIVAVARLRELNSNHIAQVEKCGRGTNIVGDLSEFNDIATRLIPKVLDVAKNSRSARVQLLRAWMQQLRGSTPEMRKHSHSECESATALATQVAGAPLDSIWRERCQGTSEAELSTLSKHARIVLEHDGRWWRFLSFRFLRARQAIRKYHSNADVDDICELARQILGYVTALTLRRQLASANQRLVKKLGPGADERAQVQYPAVAFEEFRSAEWLCVQAERHAWLSDLLREFENCDSNTLERSALSLDQARQRVPYVEALLASLSSLSQYLKPEAFAEPERLIRSGQTISTWLDQLMSGLDGLQPLMAWNLSISNRSDLLNAIARALEDYESRRLAGEHLPSPPSGLVDSAYGEWWVNLVEYSAALAWQGECHRKWPILVGVTPELHAQKVRALQKLIEEKRNLEADVIRAKWLQKQIGHRSAPWKRMFQLRRSKFGEAKRLREAVTLSLPEGLLAMRPCWLVNPGAAAEIFPFIEGLFDLVIFDEASQCPIEHAVPAIFRGKSLVVSGDEKQLPPTSFFMSNWNGDQTEDESEEEATDNLVSRDEQLEKLSIDYLLQVDDLLAAAIGNLPERLLSVHYRSRHPALIEFSNRAFYNGRLEAPPARVSSVNGYRPIRFHEVNGLYEHRTNKDEAKIVVDLLKEIWTTGGPTPTIGVVTFNQPQRDLIEDLLGQTCLQDVVLQSRYQQELSREEDNQDVGFFIKNLENVQGDERDVMIFSTTFGRDSKNRFNRRFGPVGAVGGERRLNVAVTRAKEKVVVVSSMPIGEIATALSADLAPGSQLTPAGYLQLYLAYAKAVADGDEDRIHRILERAGRKSPEMKTGDPESPFEEDVREVLEKLGFTVHSQVGDSGFRIDLGVLASDPKHGYILGIECDGAAYHSDRSARLRDVWRAKILRGRGWRLHRIWSTRWWYHRGEEIELLKLTLDSAQSHFDQEATRTPQPGPKPCPQPGERLAESWQMTLATWKQLRDELRDRGDEDALRAIGGLGTDAAHRYRVEQAIKQGKSIPKEVLDDYPDLRVDEKQMHGEPTDG